MENDIDQNYDAVVVREKTQPAAAVFFINSIIRQTVVSPCDASDRNEMEMINDGLYPFKIFVFIIFVHDYQYSFSPSRARFYEPFLLL